MKLTLEILFNDPNVVRAVIDRTMATQQDEIFWRRYLDFEETKSRVFKTYLGTVTGVTAGSVIDRNSNKPLRERKSLGSGYGEVAYLGDRYQMDNDRLDMLKSLIDKFNAARPADQVTALNNIIDYIVDDVRQVRLAPHKRMDIVVGDLRSDGKASVTLADNPQGITLLDMELPVKKIIPAAGDKDNFITYLKTQIDYGAVLCDGNDPLDVQQKHRRSQRVPEHLQDDPRWGAGRTVWRSHYRHDDESGIFRHRIASDSHH